MGTEHLQRLLFNEGEVLASRLFSTSQELAEAMLAQRGVPARKAAAAKAVKSISSNLSQMFNVKRGASPQFRELLIKAAEAQVPKGKRAELRKRLEDAFVQLRSSRVMSAALDSDKQQDALQRKGDVANTHFMLAFEPAEISGTKLGQELLSLLLERLGMSKPSGRANRGAPLPEPKRYVFCLPSTPVAHSLWRAIYNRALDLDNDRKHAVAMLQQADERRLLTTLVVPAALCAVPLVIYDPDQPNRAGFVVIYHPDDKVSVASMTPEVLLQWHHEVYVQLKPGGHYSGAVDRVEWSEDLAAAW